jgi:beta-lactamase class A
MPTRFLTAFALAAALFSTALVPSALAKDGGRSKEVDITDRTERLHALAPVLERLAEGTPGLVAVTVADLDTGHAIAINGGRDLPAASTIKIPVMVEVLRQVRDGELTLDRTVTLTEADRDCGFGDLCYAAAGETYSVHSLLGAMIDDSDNTAANMLIRLVGRRNINATMASLGLGDTRLEDSIRSDGDIRGLRTSADDMLRLLQLIATSKAIAPSSSAIMFALLAHQHHNSLLPASLPKYVLVAHKTGTLHDTLNDVGIVEAPGASYIICTFTTHLADLDDGQRFIRQASLLTFDALTGRARFADASNARL